MTAGTITPSQMTLQAMTDEEDFDDMASHKTVRKQKDENSLLFLHDFQDLDMGGRSGTGDADDISLSSASIQSANDVIPGAAVT